MYGSSIKVMMTEGRELAPLFRERLTEGDKVSFLEGQLETIQSRYGTIDKHYSGTLKGHDLREYAIHLDRIASTIILVKDSIKACREGRELNLTELVSRLAHVHTVMQNLSVNIE